jgi:hypothetical protein
MLSRRGVLVIALLSLFIIGASAFGSAIGASLTNVNDTFVTASISGATNLYAYEIKLYSAGSVGSTSFFNFLGSGTSSGTSKRGSYVYVYESKLDNTLTGVSGSGDVFNISHSGDLELCRLVVVYADGTNESVSYTCNTSNATSGGGDTGGGSGSGGSGGGGGGGGGAVASSPVTFSTKEINTKTIYQKSADNPIKLTNTGTTPITITISATGELKDHAKFLSTITLAPGETKDFVISVDGNKKGTITGTLVFTSSTGQVLGEVSAEINIASANFLFDSSLAIADRFKHLSEGKKLTFQVNLAEVGVQKDKVDVVATYTVKDFGGNSFLEESETLSVQGQKEYTKQLATQHLPPGKYVLGLELVYPGAFATSSAQFEIVPKQPLNMLLIVGVSVFVLVIGGAVVFWASRRRANLLSQLTKK